MNVAILSMQEVKNYGSFLQAWALKHIVESLGHSCEFINIVPGEQLGCYKQGWFSKIQKLVSRLWGLDFVKRIKTIYSFQTRFRDEFFSELGVNIGEQNTHHHDVVIIGSDEVFNCAQKTWFGFSSQLFGDGLDADRVITYAASFGDTNPEKLNAIGKREKVAELLRQLDSISIRDNNSLQTVEALTGIVPEKHVDPVLVWNFDKEIEHRVEGDYTRMLTRYHLDENKYMIVYTYPGRITAKDEISAICSYAKKHGLKLVSIGHYFPWCDDVVVPHPFEVLEIFQKATCIITDTFHGSIFSLKYNRNFCTIVREMNKNKLSHLLSQFGLESRIASTPDMLERILSTTIDYTLVNSMLEKEQERSIHYIKTNLY